MARSVSSFFIIIGTRICGEYPGSTPSNPAWLTPMIVIGYPLSINFLTQDIGTAGEAGLPVTVAQHCLRMAALIQVVLCGEGASQRGADTAQRKVVAAHQFSGDEFGLTLVAHA